MSAKKAAKKVVPPFVPITSSPAPIDPNDLTFNALLSNLQGNILKGHGRDHTANIFVEFDPTDLAAAREWIHKFAEEHVTSAKKQLRETERYKRNKVSGGLFAGVYLSAKGYDYFQVVPTKRPSDTSFRGGMENAKLMDPPVAEWEPTFGAMNIHLMILLADDDKKKLSIATAALIEEIRPLTTTIVNPFISHTIRVEYGNSIRNANGDGLEHFGYVDGVSQPLFLKDEVEEFKAHATPSTSELVWDPSAQLKLVLVEDKLSTAADSFGSYFVFRKLEQNVQAFKTAENALAEALNLQDEAKELAGALVVGRFEDGTPVTLFEEDGMIGSGAANNFDYKADQTGLRCPFQAHIRKSNPRGDTGNLIEEKKSIMARRGIPYGLREVDTAIDAPPELFPTGGVGLLFMSFQADLRKQFEFIQNAWVNNPGFVRPNTGIDPLIGQTQPPAAPDPRRDYQWPANYGQAGPTVPSNFASFITMKGGQYFFAPCIESLKNL